MAKATDLTPYEELSLHKLKLALRPADFVNSGSSVSLSGDGILEVYVSLAGGLNAVPEPATAPLSALGALGLLRRRR